MQYNKLNQKKITLILLSLLFVLMLTACVPGASTQRAGLPLTGDDAVINVSDQTVQNGILYIDEVISPIPGFVVIYTDLDGRPGHVIGYAPIDSGKSTNLILTIDTGRATDLLYAKIHMDLGQFGAFEYPGPDVPLTQDGQEAMVIFQAFVMQPTDSAVPDETVEPYVILITSTAFQPSEVTVPTGSIVIWISHDQETHTISSDDGLFDSGVLAGGKVFEYTFETPGVYYYHCRYHTTPGGQKMNAVIRVVENAP